MYSIQNKELGVFLATKPDNYYTGCLCDPPYALTSIVKRYGKKGAVNGKNSTPQMCRLSKGFMGQEWDSGLPSLGLWTEVYRVLCPGAFLLAYGGTRTYHRLTCLIEDAGFIILNSLAWAYGSGFPKAHDIAAVIDKKMGVEPTKLERNPNSREACTTDNTLFESGTVGKTAYLTEPTSEQAKLWKGYKTPQLKPAYEPIIFAQKPIENSYAENCLKWGCGAINVDACRIGNELLVRENRGLSVSNSMKTPLAPITSVNEGRFPSNLILSEDAATNMGYKSKYFQIIYQSKSSKKEKNSGCEKQNDHPCVKPIELNKYISTLIMPPEKRIMLQPFSGSGSEGIGALLAGWNEVDFVEQNSHYCEIAAKRLEYWI